LSILLIAHNMAVVRHVCEKVAVMYLGRIVEIAATDALFTDPRHPYTRGLLKAVPRLVPGRASTAVAVVGHPPSSIDLPTGCRFHPRCLIARRPLGHDADPELAPGPPIPTPHLAACHFAWTEAPPSHAPYVELDVERG